MKCDFSKDLYRYYGEKGETLFRRIFRPAELKYIALFRKAQNCGFAPLKMYYTLKLKRMSEKTQIQIPVRTQIGEGFYIGHCGRVIIHPDARLGKNINIGTGVTIGMENRGRRMGVPKFEGDCWIGTNAVVVGKLLYPVSILLSLHDLIKTGVVIHKVGHAKDAEIGNILCKTAGVGNSQNCRALKSLLKDIVGLAEGRAEEALRGEVAVGSLCELVADCQQGLGLKVSLGLGVAELDGSLFSSGSRICHGFFGSRSCRCGSCGLSAAGDNGRRHDEYEHECDNFFHRFSSMKFFWFTSAMLAAHIC